VGLDFGRGRLRLGGPAIHFVLWGCQPLNRAGLWAKYSIFLVPCVSVVTTSYCIFSLLFGMTTSHLLKLHTRSGDASFWHPWHRNSSKLHYHVLNL
jgi:hypothetical protein